MRPEARGVPRPRAAASQHRGRGPDPFAELRALLRRRLVRVADHLSALDFRALATGADAPIRSLEAAVVDAHRRLWLQRGLPWTPHTAYHWLHYEDPDPLARLRDGVTRLDAEGAEFDPGLVKAAERAAGL